MAEQLQIGDIVTGIYKTGKYIGEIIGEHPRMPHYVVKVLAVEKHPQQGDLHSPKNVDVPLFHNRRALGHNEKANMPKAQIRRFEGEVPDYKESLRQALQDQKQTLIEDGSDWANKSLTSLETLEEDYFN
ncbi:kinase-associated lipoprotein B [Bacillus shivajii]|uniref:kinase-associated lipoprotein B n=1 Tax=Bacillus shivajii TaxID=1983719 RepID=UPI001CF9FB11|nr:kinase-associated lipoprotein B [Bacillus shivajii]UCZ53595.1 kinase-associated lipoprotein B [Bacillus shivajii]